VNWFAATLLVSYIGICEYRAPTPWQTCENRWSMAIGVLVPSPVQGAVSLAGRMFNRRRRHAEPDQQESPP
jgi:hypothetical protein